MRVVVQRVLRASVRVDEELVGEIGAGLCVLVGVAAEDEPEDARRLADKVVGLRVFADQSGRMNRSVLEAGGSILAISQFTLLGDVRSGRRPSFTAAMDPLPARSLFDRFCEDCRALGVSVATGRFGADMRVELLGEGPVTILLDSTRLF